MLNSLKLRRIVPLLLCCSIILSCSMYMGNTQAQQNVSETFDLEVHYTGKYTYKLYPQKFTKIDLRPYANRSFIDEVAGDGKGGWADQGANDFRTFTDRGAKEYLGIPFDIIEPNYNGGKSAIVIPGQGDTPADCKNPVEINLNGTKAGGFYFLHTTAHAGDYVSGTYTINYTDGTSAYFDLLNSVHIYNNWGKSENILCRVAWSELSNLSGYISGAVCTQQSPSGKGHKKHYGIYIGYGTLYDDSRSYAYRCVACSAGIFRRRHRTQSHHSQRLAEICTNR